MAEFFRGRQVRGQATAFTRAEDGAKLGTLVAWTDQPSVKETRMPATRWYVQRVNANTGRPRCEVILLSDSQPARQTVVFTSDGRMMALLCHAQLQDKTVQYTADRNDTLLSLEAAFPEPPRPFPMRHRAWDVAYDTGTQRAAFHLPDKTAAWTDYATVQAIVEAWLRSDQKLELETDDDTGEIKVAAMNGPRA